MIFFWWWLYFHYSIDVLVLAMIVTDWCCTLKLYIYIYSIIEWYILLFSKRDSRMLPLLLPNIQLLLEDDAVSVVKRCVQATAPLNRCTLVWITDAHSTTSDMELAWIILTGIKAKIVAMIDHDNDGWAWFDGTYSCTIVSFKINFTIYLS